MSCLKNCLYNSIFLLVLLSLVSCGSMNYFNEDAGNKENDKNIMETARLETELRDIQQAYTNLQVENEKKDNSILKLKDTIDALEKKIAFQKKQLSQKIKQDNIESQTPQDLYKKARNLLIEEDYVNSASLFRAIISNHPGDSLADNSVYWLGECYYSLGDFNKAIIVFKDLERKYPRSEKVPDAFLKTGYCYLSLDDTNRAHYYLKQVLTKYPFSPASEKAQEKLKGFE